MSDEQKGAKAKRRNYKLYAERLRGACSWFETRFVDENTSHSEMLKRVRLLQMDVRNADALFEEGR